jgi:hypothetical protein
MGRHEWNDDRAGRAADDDRPADEPSGRDELVAIMARLADGDEAAIVTLLERFGTPIAAAVRRAARTRPGHLDPREVDGLAFEVCCEMMAVAAAWSPDGGALPWVWARRRVESIVDRALGQVGEVLDEARLGDLDGRSAASALVDAGGGAATIGGAPAASASQTAGVAGVVSMCDALERLVPNMASANLLQQAIEEAAISPRDREVMFEYAYEKASGNRAPAATVAAAFDMKEAAVRQVFRRARARLRDLIASDEHYAPLADLPLLA